MSDRKDYYTLLNIPRNATKSEIRKAYLSHARAWHPDRFPSGPERDHASERMAEINAAYDSLRREAAGVVFNRTSNVVLNPTPYPFQESIKAGTNDSRQAAKANGLKSKLRGRVHSATEYLDHIWQKTTGPGWLVLGLIFVITVTCTLTFARDSDQSESNHALLSLPYYDPTFGPTATGEQVENALLNGADVNARDNQRRTALILAASADNEDCVSALLAAHADVNLRASDGTTALMHAAQRGDLKIVTDLIDAQADIDAGSKDGDTALLYAASVFDNIDCIDALTGAHSDVNAQSDEGETSLMRAASISGNKACVQALIAAGADINERDNNRDTALIRAAGVKGNGDCVDALIAAHADVDTKDAEGFTAMNFALAEGSQDCVRELMAVQAE